MSITFYNNSKYDIIIVCLVGDYMGKKKKEYICGCHKITKQDMKAEISSGATEFKQLQKDTKIGTKCSSCKKKNKKRFYKYIDKLENNKVSPIL